MIKTFDNYNTRFGKNSFFESKPLSYWQFKDEYLGIHKVLNGENKGKIQFRFFNNKKNDFSDKYSVMSGSALLLGTKYVNYTEIREITIENALFRKVQINTIEYIFNNFIVESTLPYVQSLDRSNMSHAMMIGYSIDGYSLKNLMESLKIVFGDKLRKIAAEADNLGDIFDGLKILRNEVHQFQKDHFEKWEMDRDANKYNL